MLRQTVCDAVVALAHARGLDAKQLAAAAGVAPSCVALHWGGRKTPRFETLERYAKGLGLPLSHVLHCIANHVAWRVEHVRPQGELL